MGAAAFVALATNWRRACPICVRTFRSLTASAEVGTRKEAELGLGEVIAALHEVLGRLVMEEKDLTKLAAGVARIATATVQAMRQQRARGIEEPNDLERALQEVLRDIDAGKLPVVGPDYEDA